MRKLLTYLAIISLSIILTTMGVSASSNLFGQGDYILDGKFEGTIITNAEGSHIQGTFSGTVEEIVSEELDDIITVAAWDSLGKDNADYLCEVANSQEGIQLALNGAEGKTVLMLDGHYLIEAPVKVGDNTTLLGEGINTIWTLANDVNDTVLTNTNSTPFLQNSNPNINITVSNFYIDGNKDGQGQGDDDIWCVGFNSVDNLTIENMTVVNGWTAGIRTEYCSNVTIRNNRIDRSADDAIAINDNTSYVECYGNEISNWGVGRAYGAPFGIEVQDESHHVKVHDNNLYKDYVSTKVAVGIGICSHANVGKGGCHDVDVYNNTYRGISSSTINDNGLYVNKGVTRPYNITITDNTVEILGNNRSNYGIIVRYADNVEVSGNSVATDGFGIYTNRTNEASFTNNVVSGTRTGSFLLSCSNTKFIDNSFEASWTGLYSEGNSDNVLYQGNHFSTSKGWYVITKYTGTLTNFSFLYNTYDGFGEVAYPPELLDEINYQE